MTRVKNDLKLNPSIGVPIYRQIMDGISDMVASGVLKPGDQLPSIRELSAELRINPSSTIKAYTELRHAGVIELVHGKGTFVTDAPDVVVHTGKALLEQDLDALLLRAEGRGFSPAEVLDALAARIKKNTKKTGTK